MERLRANVVAEQAGDTLRRRYTTGISQFEDGEEEEDDESE